MRTLDAHMCKGEVMLRDGEQDVLRAATMYYLQDMTMEAIARHLRTSRSTVSRLLKRARDTGLVEITLRAAITRAPGLGRSISETFGVATFVVPVPDTANDMDRLEQVAIASAKLLGSWFDSGMVMGIAWGTTLEAVSRHLTHKPTRGSAVVQLNGAANNRTSGVDYTSNLISTFGSAFDASMHYFPVPAFFDFPETKAAMWRERSVRRVLEVQGRADIALFSVGAIAGAIPSHVYAAGYLDDDDVRTLQGEGVVGDVCTVFLRADGSYQDVVVNGRATGPTPDELHRIPRRVCVVAGDNKAVPLLAALRSGVVTDLVLDEVTALRLVGLVSGRDGASRQATNPWAVRR
jgi:DNA-binding transcriptional regulator LsrR (DeoR family)